MSKEVVLSLYSKMYVMYWNVCNSEDSIFLTQVVFGIFIPMVVLMDHSFIVFRRLIYNIFIYIHFDSNKPI